MSQYSRLSQIIREHTRLAAEYGRLCRNFETEEEALEASKRKAEIRDKIEILRAERITILGK